MTSSSSNEIPAQLTGFSDEIRSAYMTYTATGDRDAAQTVIYGALRDFLPPSAGIGADVPIDDSMRLTEDLGYDSVAVAEIVFFIEDLFHVTLKNEDLKTIRTVGELRAFVATKLNEEARAV